MTHFLGEIWVLVELVRSPITLLTKRTPLQGHKRRLLILKRSRIGPTSCRLQGFTGAKKQQVPTKIRQRIATDSTEQAFMQNNNSSS
jgi:hypothetical protein